MTPVFVGHRCCDHSPSSGYDQICSVFPDAGWLDGRALIDGDTTWIRPPDDAGALRQPLFHIFYGDCSGSRLPNILRRQFPGAPIVSTVHQPIRRLRDDQTGWSSIHAVDAIITVSEDQARQLSDDPLIGPIHTVPHGVWTQTFRPNNPPQASRDTVLMVGRYLRDWEGARQILELLAADGIRTIVLGADDRLPATSPLIMIRPWISESELIHLYQTAAVLLLPVRDATASNALLEAMAAGCPVVCPLLPSLVGEYLGDNSDAYPQHDYHTAADKVTRLVRDAGYRTLRSRYVSDRVQRFDWARLRAPLDEVYRRVETQTRFQPLAPPTHRSPSSTQPPTRPPDVSISTDRSDAERPPAPGPGAPPSPPTVRPSHRLSIDIVTPRVDAHTYSGGIVCILEHAQHLSEAGHRVRVVPVAPSPYPEWFGDSDFEFFTHPEPVTDPTSGQAAQRQGQFGDVLGAADLTVATTCDTLVPVAKYANGPTLYFMQHFAPYFMQYVAPCFDISDLPGSEPYTETTFYNMGMKLVANSSWLKNKVQQLTGRTDIAVCPSGIRLEHFHPRQAGRDPSVTQSKPIVTVISYGGRQAAWKGFPDMVHAVAQVRRDCPGVSLVWKVFGDASVPPRNGIADYEPLGFLTMTELGDAYRCADILLSASWYESFPLFPLEAMACGIATITTEPGTEEFARPGETAHIVEPRNLDSIAEGLRRLVMDRAYRERLADAGAAEAQKFTWHRSSEHMQTIVRDTAIGIRRAHR